MALIVELPAIQKTKIFRPLIILKWSNSIRNFIPIK
jgi:hypothetical protein